MGYTHYWYLNPTGDQQNYEKALTDIKKVVTACRNILAGPCGEDEPETENHISFNGIKDNSHETFFLEQTLTETLNKEYVSKNDKGYVFSFCKTAQKDYDIAVVSSLCILKHHLGNDVDVSWMFQAMVTSWIGSMGKLSRKKS